MLTPRTIIIFLCWTCGLSFFCHTAYAQSSTPPPMRPGNGSELEIKGGELSWPRTEQLPSSTPNDRFMQKKLNECEIGGRYVVSGVQVDESITRRLEALGVNEGTPVNILNKKGSGSVIIKVRGTRLALGKRLSEGITVREEQAS